MKGINYMRGIKHAHQRWENWRMVGVKEIREQTGLEWDEVNMLLKKNNKALFETSYRKIEHFPFYVKHVLMVPFRNINSTGMVNAGGLTEKQIKQSTRHSAIRPDIAIINPETNTFYTCSN